MVIEVDEQSFELEVVEGSRQRPVVVDFWAEWCGPCRTLGPALEAAARAREGKVVLAKLDVDSNPQLAAAFGIRGIPAVKAFRDGRIADEFVGALPPAQVEQFFDRLVPSRVDELIAAGDETSLREALQLEPGRADAAVALARLLHRRGEGDEALDVLGAVGDDFAAEGLAARIRLEREPEGLVGAFASLDAGESERALDQLLSAISEAEDGRREDLRKLVVGVLAELHPEDPVAREYRRRLSAALY